MGEHGTVTVRDSPVNPDTVVDSLTRFTAEKERFT